MTTMINDAKLEPAERLAVLKVAATSSSPSVKKNGEVNNHIHTVYSFSPYTPAGAAWAAYQAGLEVAGSVDHDSIGAAEEMLAACDIVGLGCVVGFELRVSFKDTPFGDRKLNNPDSIGIAYMTVQCVGRSRIPEVAAFLTPIRRRRRERTQRMTTAVNDILIQAGVTETPLDFERDVVALSQYHRGGGLTERHLLAGVAEKLMARYGVGEELLSALKRLNVTVPSKQAVLLLTRKIRISFLMCSVSSKAHFWNASLNSPTRKSAFPPERSSALQKVSEQFRRMRISGMSASPRRGIRKRRNSRMTSSTPSSIVLKRWGTKPSPTCLPATPWRNSCAFRNSAANMA